jgi:hypothetical protein
LRELCRELDNHFHQNQWPPAYYMLPAEPKSQRNSPPSTYHRYALSRPPPAVDAATSDVDVSDSSTIDDTGFNIDPTVAAIETSSAPIADAFIEATFSVDAPTEAGAATATPDTDNPARATSDDEVSGLSTKDKKGSEKWVAIVNGRFMCLICHQHHFAKRSGLTRHWRTGCVKFQVAGS